MKVLIISIGLIIISITVIIYQGDMSRYLQLQTFLKALAEECAAGAALYYDEEAYSRGLMIINEHEASKYADSLVDQAAEILSLEEGESISYQMAIIDDGTDSIADGGQSPSVEVKVQLTSTDLFRLSFLNEEQVIRSAKYELADY